MLQRLSGFGDSFERMSDTWSLLVRVLIASPFLLSGSTKLLSFVQTLSANGQDIRAVDFLATYLAQSFPFFGALSSVSPQLVVIAILLAGVVELVGSVMIVFGAYTRLSALVLILFTLLVNVIFHTGWSLSTVDGQLQLVNFVKNLAIVGGFLMLMVSGPGRYSVEALLKPRVPVGMGGFRTPPSQPPVQFTPGA